MMCEWKAEHIRFMRDAADYGDYHRRLAAKLLPYLPRGGRICDAGCGLGDLALALAPYFSAVTACDVSRRAIYELRQRSGEADNLRIVWGDIDENPPQTPYDGMVFCLFGAPQKVLETAKAQCRGPVCVVDRGRRDHRFSLEQQMLHSDSADWLRQTLKERGIPFQTEVFSLEFGQPFRSREDAIAFFTLYNRGGHVPTWEEVSPRLAETGRSDFPLYAPEKKELHLLCFDSRDLL